MKNEARARIRINQLLFEAGRRFFDDAKGPANIAKVWGADKSKPVQYKENEMLTIATEE